MKKYTKEIPIYFGRLHIVIAEDLTCAYRKYGKSKEETTNCKALTEDNIVKGCLEVTIYLQPNAAVKTVCHECAHAVNFIFKHVGVELSTSNDEPFCYMLGWVVEQVEDCLNKYNSARDGKTIKG